MTEKFVHEKTNKILNNKNIFYKYQSGLISSHSADLLLLFLNDNARFLKCTPQVLLEKVRPIGFLKNTI